MSPITIMYWLRAAIGVMFGIICAVLSMFMENNGIIGMSPLFYSITFALVMYMVTIYLFKMKFQNQVEEPSKVTMTGIGIYFFGWLAFYILFYTVLYTSGYIVSV
ncbi:MAG: hypothetical protein LBH62_08600 [Nitrososphaerota archaeon]|jgi:hypothetical protein|uniref:hypothetical protein n=1 Tax=Candidatus Bathycorpusculum sp. TaxID=2994959 RepID=UPI00283919BD|nr:hypothetical protein [Candidatus Termiticorpusculum sp.]MCL2257737.1 hypothetical protein [Candidatus Termiticorpusculum sp.]MCL2292134.1 hypothetical protein [Candidatus Termiticorpusculum sp.]MDR0461464.1 hypothetical protein [Nitrososphaerota archaeon]